MDKSLPTQSTPPLATEQTHADAGPHKKYQRFDLSQRLQHIFLLVSFTLLGITGLAQKYSNNPFGAGIIGIFGGIEMSRLIHRSAAVVLMATSLVHVIDVLYRVLVLRSSLSMLPVPQDFIHLYHDVLYYIGRRVRKAYYGRYNYAEKAEYLAVVWGTVIMAITGFMMWNPITTTRYLPGEYIPAAKAAHGGEALLAVLAIILWHFYHVHIRNFNKSMFTGNMDREEMEDEHPAELALIEAGLAQRLPPPDVIRKRQMVFFPIALVLAGLGAYGLFRFINYEETAIVTVPRGETAEVFVPITPTATATLVPSPTAAATEAPAGGEGLALASWEVDVAARMEARCAACHFQTALGDLSLASYQGALEGGNRGPAIVPGNPQGSILVQVQQDGNHPGQFTPEELQAIIAWIEAGAPERGTEPIRPASPPGSSGAQVSTPTPAGAAIATAAAGGEPGGAGLVSWNQGVAPLFEERCGACHVQSELGGLSLASYAAALEGGEQGPSIVPNDPEASVLVQVQQAGGHPGQLTPEEISAVVEWIQAGAPEDAPAAGAMTAPASWESGVFPLISQRCSACHVQSELGGLSLSTYAAALEGGVQGPAIVPNDPQASVLVQVQQAGGHPGQFTPEELEAIIAWIQAGALE